MFHFIVVGLGTLRFDYSSKVNIDLVLSSSESYCFNTNRCYSNHFVIARNSNRFVSKE